MTFKRVLIASCDPLLVSRLDDHLRETCVVEMAQNSGEALSKLRSELFAAMLVDQTLMGPGVVEMALRLSPGMHVVSIRPEDVSRIDEVVLYLHALEQKPNETASAREFG